MSSIESFLSLPLDEQVDVEVDVREEQVTFLVRNRVTGQLLRTLPDTEVRRLVSRIAELHGGPVDRAI